MSSRIQELYSAYKTWVITNPNLVTDVETVTRWISYYLAGKFNKSPAISELIYSLSNLFVLFNDTLILRSISVDKKFVKKDKLKYFVTILHFSEVFIEMSARGKWGNKGKWYAATLVQLIKFVSNLTLVYHYKEVPVQHPPIPALSRKKLVSEPEENEGFVLKTSGKVVRRIEGAPPAEYRDWKPVKQANDVQGIGDITKQKLAESIYVMKPLLHLGSIAAFGSQSWTQWFSSLLLDSASFLLYDDQLQYLNYEQRVEISRRKLCLLYYLIRSPVYNKHSRNIINNVLRGAANKIPLAGIICNPILQYISVWQDTYFYMWAN